MPVRYCQWDIRLQAPKGEGSRSKDGVVQTTFPESSGGCLLRVSVLGHSSPLVLSLLVICG